VQLQTSLPVTRFATVDSRKGSGGDTPLNACGDNELGSRIVRGFVTEEVKKRKGAGKRGRKHGRRKDRMKLCFGGLCRRHPSGIATGSCIAQFHAPRPPSHRRHTHKHHACDGCRPPPGSCNKNMCNQYRLHIYASMPSCGHVRCTAAYVDVALASMQAPRSQINRSLRRAAVICMQPTTRLTL
jgi:hypothetical protein